MAVGSTYVADTHTHRVNRLASDSAVVSVWGTDGRTTTRAGTAPKEFSNPVGITVDATGNFRVSGYGNHRIQEFTPNGASLAQSGTYGSAPGQFVHPGVAVAGSGAICVAASHNQRVQVLSATGAPVATHTLQLGHNPFRPPDRVLPLGNGSFATTDDGLCATRSTRGQVARRNKARGR